LSQDNEVILLKLGGSLITDKNMPFSLKQNNIDSSIEQIIRSGKRIILIHGGGSFGHPIAETYKLAQGNNENLKNQIMGIAETHAAMQDLNSKIINVFMEKRYPAIAIQPSSIFIQKGENIRLLTVKALESALSLGITPVLYGDIILDENNDFSILSGDQIILELCKSLKAFYVSKVIFAMEAEGIYIDDSGSDKLIDEVSCHELDTLNLAALDGKIDVTGGIRGKIEVCKKIGAMIIPIQLINGSIEDNIYKALRGENLMGTSITTS